jgi:N-acetylmuramoyl-L-alanine amidase
MKKVTLIGLLVLCCQASSYSTTVVLDPGHGGHGARKYGSNGGNGNGAAGPTDTLTEQWVNLQVALFTRIAMWSNPPEPRVVLTRWVDTFTITIPERIQIAKDSAADYFISIHHNGLPLDSQGTEVWWDSTLHPTEPDSAFYTRVPEARDSVFAKKTLLRIREMWRYTNRCSTGNNSHWMQGCNCVGRSNFYILHNIYHCACILTEASNIYNNSEEQLFEPAPSAHAQQEAGCIWHGWHSYFANMGIAQISNRCLGNVTASVLVDTMLWSAPVEFCWEALEQHYLQAAWDFWENGYYYTFHHWAHYTAPPFSYPAEVNFARFWTFSVNPEWEFHIYRAFFTGGPYSCDIYEPYGGGVYRIGDTLQIGYTCDAGVESSTLVDVYLDRHNGHSGYPEVVAQDVPYEDGVRWVINGPQSDSCLMKVAIQDFVGNSASTISNNAFKIHTIPLGCTSCGNTNGDANINISDVVFLVAYIFAHGNAPGDCNYAFGLGDADGNRVVNISDAVFLVAYIFAHGPAPRCQEV